MVSESLLPYNTRPTYYRYTANPSKTGQTCLVRNPVAATITRQNTDGTWSFCIPRPLDGGTVIGGTKQPHDWTPDPIPETRNNLLKNAAKWFPFTADSNSRPNSNGPNEFDVIQDIVGRRPARVGGMRVEVERVRQRNVLGGVDSGPETERAVVHAYGAGGRGFELSWGVAEEVAGLMVREGLLGAFGGQKGSL